MVFQGVYLFEDTIENNIKFGRPDATHEEVVEAARRACCHEFVEGLPEGYATRLGEGGATLSGGERQRLSIARAILKDAPIVILDEATANVDPENERDLQRAIAELTRSKTVITDRASPEDRARCRPDRRARRRAHRAARHARCAHGRRRSLRRFRGHARACDRLEAGRGCDLR